jgi:hypothetical protein
MKRAGGAGSGEARRHGADQGQRPVSLFALQFAKAAGARVIAKNHFGKVVLEV